MRHAFTYAAIALTLLFVAVFFTGRLDSKHLGMVAPRVGMQAEDLNAMVSRVSSQTGATIGTSRRVVYLLACSGKPTSATMETKALQAAAITEAQRVSARQAALQVLAADTRAGDSTIEDC